MSVVDSERLNAILCQDVHPYVVVVQAWLHLNHLGYTWTRGDVAAGMGHSPRRVGWALNQLRLLGYLERSYEVKNSQALAVYTIAGER